MAKGFGTDINLNSNEIQNAAWHNLPNAPLSPVNGQHYFDTTTKIAYYWDGTNWIPIEDTAPQPILYRHLGAAIAPSEGYVIPGVGFSGFGSSTLTGNTVYYSFWYVDKEVQLLNMAAYVQTGSAGSGRVAMAKILDIDTPSFGSTVYESAFSFDTSGGSIGFTPSVLLEKNSWYVTAVVVDTDCSFDAIRCSTTSALVLKGSSGWGHPSAWTNSADGSAAVSSMNPIPLAEASSGSQLQGLEHYFAYTLLALTDSPTPTAVPESIDLPVSEILPTGLPQAIPNGDILDVTIPIPPVILAVTTPDTFDVEDLVEAHAIATIQTLPNGIVIPVT